MHRTFAGLSLVRPGVVGVVVLVGLLVGGTAHATPPVMTLTGAAVNDYFGWAAVGVGDVNADGYSDLVASAHNSDAAGVDAGAVYVYFGGQFTDAVADLVLLGAAAGDHFGCSVDRAGDVNGDGYSDVVVGAYGNDAAGADAGAAYVYFGGPGLDATPDLVLAGAAAGDRFGYSVAGGVDVNGDGYADVVAGAYNNDAGGANAGRAYVFYGGATPDAAADLTLTGLAAGDWFGIKVGLAPDVSGDGFGAVVVGATGNDAAGSLAGAVYVFRGGASPDETADLTLLGAAAGDRFGSWVSYAGNLNGDSWGDLIVGAPMNDTGGVDAGAAYVFFGGPGADGVADVTLVGAAAGDWFGSAVGRAPDLNADGYGDVVVGAYLNDAAGTDAGAAYVYYGGADPDSVPDVVRRGAAAGDNFGYSVGFTGGFDLHGFGSLVVSAIASDVGGSNAGAAYVYNPSPLAAAQRQAIAMQGEAAGDNFGISVAGAGDMNGDGYDDVVIGAHQRYATAATGKAYVRFGGPDPPAALTLSGEAAGDYFGASVAGAGDVNGDGYDDVVIGAYGNDAGGTYAGAAYVFLGSANPDGTPDLTFYGGPDRDQVGYAVGKAGDVNGDGYGDWIVGALSGGGGAYPPGQAHVFFGGPSPDALPDVTLTGVAPSDGFGGGVDGVGDVNGDGYDDVIVGAGWNDAAGADAGQAYVYFGGSSPDAVADMVLTGEGWGDTFGFHVQAAGDVNGDGYDDVIVGADQYGLPGIVTGAAYLYFGGSTPDTTVDLTMRGAGGGCAFGFAVGSAGDVNRDGYDDWLVGALNEEPGGSQSGVAYLYYGGLSPDTVADVTWRGSVEGGGFGTVAGAGDFMADGFPDVVVGACTEGTVGWLAGGAYVFDFNRYFVTAPNGGEVWSVNGPAQVSWLGAEAADLWLSTDGGATYDLLERQVGGGETNSRWVAAPSGATTQALVKVAPYEASWMPGLDVSDSLFTIYDPSAGVGEPGARVLRLNAPRPNPASGSVRLELALPTESVVSVSVYDLAGREVARPIAAETFAAGTVSREWRPQGLAPGVYAVRARVGEARLARRLVWLGGR